MSATAPRAPEAGPHGFASKADIARLEGKIETGFAELKSELASKADLKELKNDIFKVAGLVCLAVSLAVGLMQAFA